MNRMTPKDYGCMAACYALLALMTVMVLFPADTAVFLMGVLP